MSSTTVQGRDVQRALSELLLEAGVLGFTVQLSPRLFEQAVLDAVASAQGVATSIAVMSRFIASELVDEEEFSEDFAIRTSEAIHKYGEECAAVNALPPGFEDVVFAMRALAKLARDYGSTMVTSDTAPEAQRLHRLICVARDALRSAQASI